MYRIIHKIVDVVVLNRDFCVLAQPEMDSPNSILNGSVSLQYNKILLHSILLLSHSLTGTSGVHSFRCDI